MKKVLLFFAAFISLNISAQYINNIDEADLIGEWTVTSSNGEFRKLGGKPTVIKFSENYSEIKIESGKVLFCRGFFISNSNTKLHFLCITGADGYTDHRLLNYKIKLYTGPNGTDGNIMRLSSFDEKETFELKQVATSVNATRKENYEEEGIYNLQGIKIPEPEGIYIQKGKKYVTK